MNLYDYKRIYHRMPAKYRKHGDMPTLTELVDDVDAYIEANPNYEV